MILVLDNAAYHKERVPEYFSLGSATKKKCAEHLRQMGVATISWCRGGAVQTFDLSRPLPRYPKGPSEADLRAILEQQLEERPGNFFKSKLQVLFEERSLIYSLKRGQDATDYHQIIYTVPYYSEFQPIELAWAIRSGGSETTTHQSVMQRPSVSCCVKACTGRKYTLLLTLPCVRA